MMDARNIQTCLEEALRDELNREAKKQTEKLVEEFRARLETVQLEAVCRMVDNFKIHITNEPAVGSTVIRIEIGVK